MQLAHRGREDCYKLGRNGRIAACNTVRYNQKSRREVGRSEQAESYTAVYRQIKVTPRDARAVAGQKDKFMLAVVQLGLRRAAAVLT